MSFGEEQKEYLLFTAWKGTPPDEFIANADCEARERGYKITKKYRDNLIAAYDAAQVIVLAKNTSKQPIVLIVKTEK